MSIRVQKNIEILDIRYSCSKKHHPHGKSALSVLSVGEFKNHPHGKFVRFEILLPFGQWVHDKSRVQEKSVFSVSIRVPKNIR